MKTVALAIPLAIYYASKLLVYVALLPIAALVLLCWMASVIEAVR